MPVRVGCIVNATRKIGSQTQVTLDLMEKSPDIELILRYTEYAKHAIELVGDLAAEQCDCIIAIGGDGTCNEVANGLMQLVEQPVFGVIPNGTGNDLQRTIGAFDPKSFVEALRKCESRPIDICEICWSEQQRYAINIAGFGFDAQVIQLLERQRKAMRMGGKFSYAWSIARAFFSYRKPEVVIRWKQGEYKGKLLMAAICNGKVFGHGLTINRNAELNSGKLNVTLLGKVSLKDYVLNLSKLKKGDKIDHPEVQYFETEEIELSSASQPVFVQADGELVTDEKVKFTIVPGAIKLLQTS